MSLVNIKTATWIEFLPTEIIFLIFDFLSNNDILYTFFFFSQRLNNLLLQNQCYLNYLEFPTKHLNTWENILQIIGSKTESLYIDTIDLPFRLTYFTNLKSIIISSAFGLSDEQLELILSCTQFKNLHSFKLKENKLFFDGIFNSRQIDQDYILEKCFNNDNSLQIFQYSFLTTPFLLMVTHNFQINFNLHSLTLMLSSFGHIFTLIEYTPNLKYLNVQTAPPYTLQEAINKADIKLNKFHLELNENITMLREECRGSIDFDRLTNVIKGFSSSLTCLSLNLIKVNIKTADDFPFNGVKLQQLLESMIELKQFHLYAKLNSYRMSVGSILSKFTNQFWFNHNLSFGMHGKYLYTLPFHFDYLHECFDDFSDIESNNCDFLKTNPRIWYNVKSIELRPENKYKLNLLKKLIIQMPKLTIIKFIQFSPSHIDKRQGERKQIDLILNNETTIECTSESVENEKEWLIYALPNLRHLVLSRCNRLTSVESRLAQILNERIERLFISEYSGLEQLTEITYVYLSNVQHIYFYLDVISTKSQWYANIVMKLLTNFKTVKTLMIYTNQLTSNCFDHCIDSRFMKLTELIQYSDMQKILQTYEVKYYQQYCLFSKKIL